MQFEYGSEIIVSPWTMSANVMAVIKNNLIPMFCDIDKSYFNTDPEKLPNLITKKQRYILTSDIFGQSCDINRIQKWQKHVI